MRMRIEMKGPFDALPTCDTLTSTVKLREKCRNDADIIVSTLMLGHYQSSISKEYQTTTERNDRTRKISKLLPILMISGKAKV